MRTLNQTLKMISSGLCRPLILEDSLVLSCLHLCPPVFSDSGSLMAVSSHGLLHTPFPFPWPSHCFGRFCPTSCWQASRAPDSSLQLLFETTLTRIILLPVLICTEIFLIWSRLLFRLISLSPLTPLLYAFVPMRAFCFCTFLSLLMRVPPWAEKG